jgi:hypothetical protein
MNISRLVRSKPPPLRDDLIARAARSWDPEFPGRMELPRKYANICRQAMILAASKKRNPNEILHEVCRIKGIDELEVIEALEALALRIEREDYALKEKHGMRSALTSRAKDLLGRVR